LFIDEYYPQALLVRCLRFQPDISLFPQSATRLQVLFLNNQNPEFLLVRQTPLAFFLLHGPARFVLCTPNFDWRMEPGRRHFFRCTRAWKDSRSDHRVSFALAIMEFPPTTKDLLWTVSIFLSFPSRKFIPLSKFTISLIFFSPIPFSLFEEAVRNSRRCGIFLSAD